MKFSNREVFIEFGSVSNIMLDQERTDIFGERWVVVLEKDCIIQSNLS